MHKYFIAVRCNNIDVAPWWWQLCRNM